VPAPRTRSELVAPASNSEPSAAATGTKRGGEATRSRLLDAALPVLAETGYQSTRVDDVVRRAGLSHGTFYVYFANKEDLFRALAERCADEAAEVAASLGPVPPGAEGRAALRTWLAAYLAFYRSHGVVVRAWAENQVDDRALARLGARSFERIAGSLRAAIAEGSDDTPRQVELKAAALLATLERMAYVTTSRDIGIGDEALIDGLATFVQRGFFPR